MIKITKVVFPQTLTKVKYYEKNISAVKIDP
jgi:hypothetical protein